MSSVSSASSYTNTNINAKGHTMSNAINCIDTITFTTRWPTVIFQDNVKFKLYDGIVFLGETGKTYKLVEVTDGVDPGIDIEAVVKHAITSVVSHMAEITHEAANRGDFTKHISVADLIDDGDTEISVTKTADFEVCIDGETESESMDIDVSFDLEDYVAPQDLVLDDMVDDHMRAIASALLDKRITFICHDVRRMMALDAGWGVKYEGKDKAKQ